MTPHMEQVARQVCLHAGGDTLTQGDDVTTAIQALRDYFQPDAVDHIFKQADKFPKSKKTDQTMERFLMEFGISRARKEKAYVSEWGRFPRPICYVFPY